MSTFNPNNSSPAPRGAFGRVHRGIWIGGGLMALTIVALAATLVVKSNDNAAATPVAATDVSPATAAGTPTDPSTSVAQAPAQTTVVPVPVPVRGTPYPQSAQQPPQYAPQSGTVQVAPGGPSYANESAVQQQQQQQVASVGVCQSCGVIASYSTVQLQGQSNGVGAVAGGLGGALIGSKIGGRGNHTIGGLIGAVGGGLLGNAVEKHERTVTEYDVHVRMEDGSVRTVRQASVPRVGEHVHFDGNVMHAERAQG